VALAYRLGDALVVGAILVLIALAGTNQLSRMLGTERELGFGISRVRFPIEAIDFARQVGIGGRPFNCLATGGYLAWARFPEERVFVDGRLEAYPEPFFRSYFRALDDPTAWPETAAQYQLDYALLYHVWSNRFPLARYLAGGHGWTLVYYDEIASLFLPVSAANAEVRERAAGEFAAIKARRLRAPVPAPPSSIERAIHVPVEETYRQIGYGDFLRTIGQNAEAVEAYKRALALDPDGSEARLSLAMAHWYSGNRNQALLELRDLVRREPTNERAARTLEEAQAAMGRQGAER
jgi:tetratricopeptide (TPR) repeat protein